MNKPDIETEIQMKGKTAPRVTPAHIESLITSEHYFTAADGVAGLYSAKASATLMMHRYRQRLIY